MSSRRGLNSSTSTEGEKKGLRRCATGFSLPGRELAADWRSRVLRGLASADVNQGMAHNLSAPARAGGPIRDPSPLAVVARRPSPQDLTHLAAGASPSSLPTDETRTGRRRAINISFDFHACGLDPTPTDWFWMAGGGSTRWKIVKRQGYGGEDGNTSLIGGTSAMGGYGGRVSRRQGEKSLGVLAEMLSKLRFYGYSTLSTPPIR
jgi:hypothetical protein